MSPKVSVFMPNKALILLCISAIGSRWCTLANIAILLIQKERLVRSDLTLRLYVYALARLVNFAITKRFLPEKFSRDHWIDFQEYQRDKFAERFGEGSQRRETTQAAEHRMLFNAFDILKQYEHIEVNPIPAGVPSRDKYGQPYTSFSVGSDPSRRDITVPSLNQLAALRTNLHRPYRIMFDFGFYSAARCSELLRAVKAWPQAQPIEGGHRIDVTGKNRKEVEILAPAELYDDLMWLHGRGLTDHIGHDITNGSFNRRLKLAAENTGIDRISPHMLRHFGASHMQAELDDEGYGPDSSWVVSTHLNHSTPEITKAYYIHPIGHQPAEERIRVLDRLFGHVRGQGGGQ